ncbi:MAG: T9SS type A sorting domain-containing protein, partial [Paludibacteraceae bacterium]
TVTPLQADTTLYRYSSTQKGIAQNRFMIVDRASSSIDLTNMDFGFLDGYITPSKVLTAINYTGEEGGVQLYSADGVKVQEKKMLRGTNMYPVTLQNGVYIMSLESAGKRQNIKIFVNNK